MGVETQFHFLGYRELLERVSISKFSRDGAKESLRVQQIQSWFDPRKNF